MAWPHIESFFKHLLNHVFLRLPCVICTHFFFDKSYFPCQFDPLHHITQELLSDRHRSPDFFLNFFFRRGCMQEHKCCLMSEWWLALGPQGTICLRKIGSTESFLTSLHKTYFYWPFQILISPKNCIFKVSYFFCFHLISFKPIVLFYFALVFFAPEIHNNIH